MFDKAMQKKFMEALDLLPAGWRVVLMASPQLEADLGHSHPRVASAKIRYDEGFALCGIRSEDAAIEWTIPYNGPEPVEEESYVS